MELFPDYVTGRELRSLSDTNKRSSKRVENVNRKEQQRCHRVPNDVLTRAYNTTMIKEIKEDILKFNFSSYNIRRSTNNKKHSKHEQKLKAGKAKYSDIKGKQSAIYNALQNAKKDSFISDQSIAHILKTMRKISEHYNKIVENMINEQEGFGSSTIIETQLKRAKSNPPNHETIRKHRERHNLIMKQLCSSSSSSPLPPPHHHRSSSSSSLLSIIEMHDSNNNIDINDYDDLDDYEFPWEDNNNEEEGDEHFYYDDETENVNSYKIPKSVMTYSPSTSFPSSFPSSPLPPSSPSSSSSLSPSSSRTDLRVRYSPYPRTPPRSEILSSTLSAPIIQLDTHSINDDDEEYALQLHCNLNDK